MTGWSRISFLENLSGTLIFKEPILKLFQKPWNRYFLVNYQYNIAIAEIEKYRQNKIAVVARRFE